ncbi:UBP-type zinc finger domain-containing protein [Streptomyces sp. NBC_00234]|uniref:UBP-type zinc finger domain-containing protein n=1 Tax=Streptomyces sp. NBC_00234 TaxID=2903638 RepID=UPI002E2CB5E7|nr:UBP-type zinc finger domain-containing protein [Streptomyces sp. NBC_00234]
MTSASRWTVAPDGGRPDGRSCVHLGAMSTPSDPLSENCEECSALGFGWMRLRWCTTCGHVGCCDSSQGRHAYSHHVATGHPLVLSLAPDEHWAWCYVDELFLISAPTTRGSAV